MSFWTPSWWLKIARSQRAGFGTPRFIRALTAAVIA